MVSIWPNWQPNKTSIEDFDYTGAVSQVALGETVAINVGVRTLTKSLLRADLVSVCLDYDDMFGNPYKTTYPDWAKDISDFKWEQPKPLRGRT